MAKLMEIMGHFPFEPDEKKTDADPETGLFYCFISAG